MATISPLALVAGWRRSAPGVARAVLGVGAATGFVGGLTGLMGPIAVLFQLSSQDGAARSRANVLVFLTVSSVLLLPLMALQGVITSGALWLGLVLTLPYGAGSLLGQRLFSPDRETLYRRVAYGIIAAAILLGLPIWE